MPYLLTDDEHRALSVLAATLQANAGNLSLFLARDCQRMLEAPPIPSGPGDSAVPQAAAERHAVPTEGS